MPAISTIGDEISEGGSAGVTLLRAVTMRVGRLRFAFRHGIGNIVRPGSHSLLVLGVMTALLLAILPLPFLGLELFVGFMQALVFAILTLTFTLIAIEAPHDVEHAAHEGDGENREEETRRAHLAPPAGTDGG